MGSLAGAAGLIADVILPGDSPGVPRGVLAQLAMRVERKGGARVGSGGCF